MSALVADAGVAFGLVLIIVLAVIVAVVGTIGLVLKTGVSILRWLFGGGHRAAGGPATRGKADAGRVRGPAPLPAEHTEAWEGVICENARCGHGNPPHAVYCGRCGRRLWTR